MFVKIPERHKRYIEMLVEAKCVFSEEHAKTLAFEDGLYEAESDIYRGSSEPDMELSLLRGKQITIEVPDKPEYLHRLKVINQAFNVAPARAALITFLLGLFNQYLLLKGSNRYQEDKGFRRMVNEMPHDLFYDVMVSDFEEEHAQE